MKKLLGITLVILLLAIAPLTSFAQKKELFLNQVIQLLKDEPFSFQYLLDSAYSYPFDFIDSTMIFPAVSALDSVSVREIIAQTKIANSEKWDKRYLVNCKVVSKKSRKNRVLNREYVSIRYSITFCDLPIYNSTGDLAMIRVGRDCGKHCGEGCFFFFQKDRGKLEHGFENRLLDNLIR